MKPSVHLKQLLRVDISSDSSYSDIEIGLLKLKRIVKSASHREVAKGATKKMLSLFYSKNMTAKVLALKYLAKISRHVDEVDTNIVHMFYSTDSRLNNLAVKFVELFSRFFRDNDVIFYHVYRSKSRYRGRAMRSLMAHSERYLAYEQEAEMPADLDLFENIKRSSPEEYFKRLELPKLVELASLYPCLIRHLRFTHDFLLEEMKKTERYDSRTLRRLGKVLNTNHSERTGWTMFLDIIRNLHHGKLGASLEMLKILCGLEISSKYKCIFSVFVERISRLCIRNKRRTHIHAKNSASEKNEFKISTILEIRIRGLLGNRVYKLLKKTFNRSVQRLSKDII